MVLFILLSQNIFAQDNEAKKAYEEFKNQAKGNMRTFVLNVMLSTSSS